MLSLLSLAIFIATQNKSLEKHSSVEILIPNKPLSSLSITSPHFEVELIFKENLWWMSKPHVYLADQDFIANNIQVMLETQPIEQFQLEEDHFKVNPGKAFFDFVFQDGERLRLIIGALETNDNNLYVYNKDLNRIFVVHNIWGQFLYYSLNEYYHKSLPILGEQVKSAELKNQSNKTIWRVGSIDSKQAKVFFNDKEYKVLKSQLVLFFKTLGEFSLQDLEFNQKLTEKNDFELIVQTEKGNITFPWFSQTGRIFVPHFNVFAKQGESSLNSLTTELEKVIKNEQK